VAGYTKVAYALQLEKMLLYTNKLKNCCMLWKTGTVKHANCCCI